MQTLSTILSSGVSVGIFAGVLSGIFYLVVAGIRWAGEVHQQSGEWFYQQVRRRFYPTAIPGGKNDNGLVMDPDTNQVREFIERLVETLVSGGLDDVNVNRLYLHPEYERMFTCYHALLCDNLARLSFTLHMAIANKPVPEEDSPSEAHAALKQLVQRIINEAMTLPKLQELSKLSHGDSLQSESVTAEDMASKTYEDILATAILNKVIERFQQYSVGVSSQSPVDSNSNLLHHKEFQPQFISRLEIGMSGGSDSDVTRSTLELDTASWSGSEPMSLTIEECVETTMYDTSDEDGIPEEKVKTSGLDYFLSGLNFIKCHRVPFPELGMDLVDGPGSEGELGEDEESSESNASPQPTDLLSPIDSWEENWLFQRRRLKASRGANQPMSVPMLVPNPSEDFRALIGDRDAEEISDLSECSDGALEDLVCEVETAEDGQVSGEYASLEGGDPELAETRNLELSVDCLSEFGQQDSEYTEDYASVTRRQLNSLTRLHEPEEAPKPVPKPRTLGVPLHVCVGDEPSETSPEDSNIDQPQTAIELATPPRPGTIAEREHKKWESAPPLANNPYSSENISKRLHRKLQYNSHSNTAEVSNELPEFQNEPIVPKTEEQSPKVVCADNDLNFERYGRDYYINNSKFASGQRKYQTQPVSVEIVSSNVPQAQSPQVSGGSSLAQLEGQILHRDVYHASFRARNASPNFTMNPVYEQQEGAAKRPSDVMHRPPAKSGDKCFSESGYSSSLDSLADPALRLTPPSKPQMVETSFESLSSMRKFGSLRVDRKKRSGSPTMGGSLRVKQFSREGAISVLW